MKTADDGSKRNRMNLAKEMAIRVAFRLARAAHKSGFANARPYAWTATKFKRMMLTNSSVLEEPFSEVEVDKIRLRVPYSLTNDYILKSFEPETMNYLRKWVRPGMVAIDVGANIGYVTVFLGKKVEKEGRVHAFEPAPSNLSFLRDNVSRSSLTNIVIHEGCRSSATG